MPLLGKSEGVKRYIQQLSGALLQMEDVDVREVGPMNGAVRRITRLPKLGFIYRQGKELVTDPLRAARDVDLLHYTDTYGPLAPVRTRIVITVHDTTFVTHPGTHETWVPRWLGSLASVTWPRASAIIAVSHATANDLCTLGVPRGKIYVVHHGVDHVKPDAGHPPGALTKGKYIAYLGNIEPRKDVPTLLAAFQEALPRLPVDIDLAIAGKQAWGPELSRDPAMHRRVKTLGWLSDSALASFMANSLAFVYPSVYEGFGLPPLEALHLGAYVIVGDTPVAREILGQHAAYFTPGDAPALATQLLRAVGEYGRARAGYREHTALFTWERAAERTAEVYRRVLE